MARTRYMSRARITTVALSSTAASIVVSGARDKWTEVHVRTIGIAGQTAILALDGTSALATSLTNPTGNVYLLPSGESQWFLLAPGEALYGKGTVDDVLVSSIATDVPGVD